MNEIVVMTTSIIAEIGSSRKPSFMTRVSVKCSQSKLNIRHCSRSPKALTKLSLPLKKYLNATE